MCSRLISCFASIYVAVALDVPAPRASKWLGRGHDVVGHDYWSSSSLGTSLFQHAALPASCFVKSAFCNRAPSGTRRFDSVSHWAREYATSFGLGASFPFSGMAASIKGSLGVDGSASVQTSRHITHFSKVDQRSCFTLQKGPRCASNSAYLQADFMERLHWLNQSVGSPYTEKHMQRWNKVFLTRFGTHISMETYHGAKLQALASADSQSAASSSCMDFQLCLGVNLLNVTGAVICPKRSSCDGVEQRTHDFKATCSALGGDPDLRHEICSGKPSSETFNKWFGGVDDESGSSVIGTKLEPLSDFVQNLDSLQYYQHAMTIEKAIEFRSCRLGAGESWEAGKDGEFGCKCMLECRNGGTLDKDTCSCRCPGTAMHGWTGIECGEHYNKCQSGAEAKPACSIRDCEKVIEGGKWRNSAWRRSWTEKCKCSRGFVVRGDSAECSPYNGKRYFAPDLTPFACRCRSE